jgi:hypothetical protein
MAKHVLDGTKVRASIQQVCRERMSKGVRVKA